MYPATSSVYAGACVPIPTFPADRALDGDAKLVSPVAYMRLPMSSVETAVVDGRSVLLPMTMLLPLVVAEVWLPVQEYPDWKPRKMLLVEEATEYPDRYPRKVELAMVLLVAPLPDWYPRATLYEPVVLEEREL